MAHDHDHSPPADLGPAFRWAVGLNAAYVLVEGSAGWITGSLALLADAAHNLTDVAGLLIAWGAAVLAKRAVTARHTWGLGRATILAALFNAIAILVGVGAVTWEAVHRLSDPVAVPGLTVKPAGLSNPRNYRPDRRTTGGKSLKRDRPLRASIRRVVIRRPSCPVVDCHGADCLKVSRWFRRGLYPGAGGSGVGAVRESRAQITRPEFDARRLHGLSRWKRDRGLGNLDRVSERCHLACHTLRSATLQPPLRS